MSDHNHDALVMTINISGPPRSGKTTLSLAMMQLVSTVLGRQANHLFVNDGTDDSFMRSASFGDVKERCKGITIYINTITTTKEAKHRQVNEPEPRGPRKKGRKR